MSEELRDYLAAVRENTAAHRASAQAQKDLARECARLADVFSKIVSAGSPKAESDVERIAQGLNALLNLGTKKRKG